MSQLISAVRPQQGATANRDCEDTNNPPKDKVQAHWLEFKVSFKPKMSSIQKIIDAIDTEPDQQGLLAEACVNLRPKSNPSDPVSDQNRWADSGRLLQWLHL